MAKKGLGNISKAHLFNQIANIEKGDYSSMLEAIRTVNATEQKATCRS